MRKNIARSFTLALSLTLVACGGSASSSDSAGAQSAVTQKVGDSCSELTVCSADGTLLRCDGGTLVQDDDCVALNMPCEVVDGRALCNPSHCVHDECSNGTTLVFCQDGFPTYGQDCASMNMRCNASTGVAVC